MSIMITRSISEDVVTPESAELGDFASSDMVADAESMTIRDVLDELRFVGIAHVERTHNGLAVRHDSDLDYRTAAETTRTTHIVAPNTVIARVLPLLAAAYQRRTGMAFAGSRQLLAAAR